MKQINQGFNIFRNKNYSKSEIYKLPTWSALLDISLHDIFDISQQFERNLKIKINIHGKNL